MKVRLFGLIALGCALGLIVSFPGSDSSQSQTQKVSTGTGLSQAEQELLTEINGVRANPARYATYLENLKPFFKGKEYKPAGHQGRGLTTEEGWAAVEEAIKFLRALQPVGPFTMSSGLNTAAQRHVKEQSGSGATGHRGGNKSLIEERVKLYGTWQGAIGENLSYGKDSPRDRILTWLIDDGVASRGHRRRLLSTDYKVAGLSCGPHPEWGAMCCLTLTGGFVDLKPAQTTSTNANVGTQTNKSKPRSSKAPKS